MLHWNIIYKSTIVTWNVGPYKLIRLPGHPNLNLSLTCIKYNKYEITAITILLLRWNGLTIIVSRTKNNPTNNNIPDYPDYNHKINNWKFPSKIPKTKNSYTWKTGIASMSEKN